MSAPRARLVHGRHPLLAEGGAAVDDDLPVERAREVAEGWRDALVRLIAADPVDGIGAPALDVRGGHVSLGLPAAIDVRDAAADLLDQATGAEPAGPLKARPDLALRSLVARAHEAGLPAFVDEGELVVGMGVGARIWPLSSLPRDLSGASRVPTVLVTGTNGKTTTVNLVASIAAAAGYTPAAATSTGIRVGREILERGDWSGAGAARIVARDPHADFAVLETARGGLLRRGLLVDGADVAILTNISDDHLGDWGITTVEELALVKRIVADSIRAGGAVISSADDPLLESVLGRWHEGRPDARWLRFSARRAADAWRDGDLLRFPGGEIEAREVPLTLGGAARHNVENALAAALAASALGMPASAIQGGLRALSPSPKDNPGRSNLFSLRGARILVDYAHNPDGLGVLRDLAERLAPQRRLMLLGQAGDRPESSVLALAAVAASIQCARYVLKPLPGYARGRPPEEVVAWLRHGLLGAGIPEEAISEVGDEQEGVEKLLALLQPGDLCLMLVHEDLDAALEAISSAGAAPASL